MNDLAPQQHARSGHDATLDRQRRLLVLALAGSVAVHVVLATMLPAFHPSPNPPRPLDVLLIEAPRQAPSVERAEAPRRLAITARKLRRSRTPAQPVATPESEPPRDQQRLAIVQPHALPSAPSALSAPQPVADPPPSPRVEQQTPASAAAPPPERRDTAATSPPRLEAAHLRNAPARYPPIARRNGIEGRVLLKVLVSRDGRAAHVQIDHTSGSSELDGAALEAVRSWQFAPARRGAEAVESWIVIPVDFVLRNAR